MKKKGISLIVLSITILVMAILAATVIISLENSGIIGRAKSTTTSQNYADEYTRLMVIKNGILTDNLGTITVEEYINELKSKGIIEEAVIDNGDETKTITTKSGFEVVIVQNGSSDLKVSLKDDGGANAQNKVAQAVFSDGTILSWEELKLASNGSKYGYNAAAISDTKIDSNAFYECYEITSITILEGVTEIGTGAFSMTESLKDITLPDSISNIDGSTLDEAYGLENIYVYPSNPNYATVNGVLYDKAMTKLIKYPYNKQDEVYTLPTTVTTIGGNAFYQGVAPFELVIPSTGKTLVVEDFAFGQCSITSITLPANINKDIILSMNGSMGLMTIRYGGTVAQWNALGLDEYQYELFLPPVDVICSNGTVALNTALSE